MTKDYLNIGPCPADEECVQVGSENYRARARKEMEQYILLIRDGCGAEPEGARLTIKWFPHDGGTYGEVVCEFWTEKGQEYAYEVEGDAPSRWNDNVKAPRFDDVEFEKTELIAVPPDVVAARYYDSQLAAGHKTESKRRPNIIHTQWLSEIPDECQIPNCGVKIVNEFIDGGTQMGPWANMCPACSDKVGIGLGEGMGQRYKRAVDGNFYVVEGGIHMKDSDPLATL